MGSSTGVEVKVRHGGEDQINGPVLKSEKVPHSSI